MLCYRRMAEIMLEEIGRQASDDAGANANSGVAGRLDLLSSICRQIGHPDHCQGCRFVSRRPFTSTRAAHLTLSLLSVCSIPISSHREGYALAAGAALGLIMLGAGHSTPGMTDLNLVDRLRWVAH